MYRLLFPLTAMLLGACAAPPPSAPAGPLTVINVLSWDNPLSGKRDGLRSGWPLAGLNGHAEQFPLAQVRQCSGAACSWGVLKARRLVHSAQAGARGVRVEVALQLNVARSQEAHDRLQQSGMAIPSDVPALSASRTLERTVELEYGKVEHVELDFGIAYDLCAERKGIDRCPLPYF